jgi:hypothetical protein
MKILKEISDIETNALTPFAAMYSILVIQHKHKYFGIF